MNKKEDFKEFVRLHPELVAYVKDKSYTWQDFYEIYDIYGSDEKAWSKFKEDDRAAPLSELSNIVKNINMDNIQKYINNAQKTINVIQELTTKAPAKDIPIPKTPRPINKFFGD